MKAENLRNFKFFIDLSGISKSIGRQKLISKGFIKKCHEHIIKLLK